MPIYCYKCKHESREILLAFPLNQKCSCGCPMTRDYAAEHAGLPPFKAYNTEAFYGGITHVTTRDQERRLQKESGFVRVS